MTTVSQRISNFIGGVSQQADEKILPGQVKDALNCYPDPTLGMIKRPGGKFTSKLQPTLSALAANSLDSNAMFTIFRDDQTKYVATITSGGVIRVWDLTTGIEKTVTQSGISSYLTATDYRNLKTLTVNDFTYIVNSEKTVAALAAPTFTPLRQAVISLLVLEHNTTYTVTINRTSYTYTSPTAGGGSSLTIPMVMKGISDAIGYPTGLGLTKTIVDGVLVLTSTADMSVSVAGGNAGTDGKYIRVFNNSVDSITRLPEQCVTGTVVKIANTSGAAADYYVKFVGSGTSISGTYSQTGTTVTVTTTTAHGFTTHDLATVNFSSGAGVNGTYAVTVTSSTVFTYTSGTSQTTSGNVSVSGALNPGYWEETISPSASTGLDSTTMPVVLIRLANGNFQAAPLNGSLTVNNLALTWEPRLVGDDDTNSHPSFVGFTIQDIFLFANRLGFLTEDNISMSQAGDYYNFYSKSALTQVAADPIDLSVASIKPAVVHSVIPSPQGLLLFSANQQFVMEAENGTWTPSTVTIRTISNYESDKYVKPVDLGSTAMFVNKNQSWTRAFEITTRGQREAPSVFEATRAVPEWVPQSLSMATGSPQNGLWVGSSRTSPTIYLFRYYDEGNERKLSSWIRWTLPSNVIHTAVQSDTLYIITTGTEGYTVLAHSLGLSPTTGGLVNSLGNAVDPYLDAWFRITTTPTFANGVTKVYIPTHFNTTKTMQYVVGTPISGANNNSGYSNTITVLSDGGGSYFNIPGNVTGNYIFVGYEYQMEVVLPRYNYSAGDQGYDFTGVTRTARMKFYTGLGGTVSFSITDNTRAVWVDVPSVRLADFYKADTSPFTTSYVYSVPVYQRPDNYVMKVLSNNPFPVSLVALQWEGQYSSGFYRRA
jgi:hypothetical protein